MQANDPPYLLCVGFPSFVLQLLLIAKKLFCLFSYNGQGESTNMGVVVINFPTGWHGDQESLDFVGISTLFVLFNLN